MKTLKEIEADVAELGPQLRVAQRKVKEFKRLINESAALQEEVKVISINSGKTLKRAMGQLKGVGRRKKEVEGLDNLAQQLQELQQQVEALREIRPETRSFFSSKLGKIWDYLVWIFYFEIRRMGTRICWCQRCALFVNNKEMEEGILYLKWE